MYIKYKLLQNGEQPYETLKKYKVNFEGGVVVKNGEYFGYLEGEQVTEGLNACINFDMIELTEEQALNFFNLALEPSITTIDGSIKTLQPLQIINSKIIYEYR